MMKLARFVILMNHQSRFRDRSHVPAKISADVEPEVEINWHEFLNEGIEIDSEIGKGSSDESDWSELSDSEDSLVQSDLAVSSQIITIDETECSSGQ